MDRRLEAIAGLPVFDVASPLWSPPIEAAGTGLFVGRLEPRDPPALQCAMFSGGNNPTIFWNQTLSLIMAGTTSQPRQRTTGIPGVYAFTAEFLAGSRRGLGVSSSAAQYFRGPFRALAYDRTLNDYQIQILIQRLLTDLTS